MAVRWADLKVVQWGSHWAEMSAVPSVDLRESHSVVRSAAQKAHRLEWTRAELTAAQMVVLSAGESADLTAVYSAVCLAEPWVVCWAVLWAERSVVEKVGQSVGVLVAQ